MKKILIAYMSPHGAGAESLKWKESPMKGFSIPAYPDARINKVGNFDQKVRITIEEID